LKWDLPRIKKIEIKYGCGRSDERNIVPYRNFLIFKLEFELKFREASMS
jgi:hypothetical protein